MFTCSSSLSSFVNTDVRRLSGAKSLHQGTPALCLPGWELSGDHPVSVYCRHQDEVLFVSERDGNMELYSRRVKNEMSSKKSYQRLTSDPSLQASIMLCGPTLQLATLSGSRVMMARHASRLCACPQ